VWLKVEAKIGAEPSRDSCFQVRVGSNAFASSFEECTKMLEAWSGRKRQHFITVKTPGQAIPHIHEGGGSSMVDDGVWINAISKSWEGGYFNRQKRACWKGKCKRVGMDCLEPRFECWLDGIQGLKKRFIGTAKQLDTLKKIFQANVGGLA
jgi:hypothetical protein